MTLKEIVERFDNLAVYEERTSSDEYFELVFYNKECDKWHEVLSEALGPAAKPVGAKPTAEHLKLVVEYGGLRPDQTLFIKGFNGITVIAMLWPWQDDLHTTLKIICINN